jgi:hypothetical protein
MIHAVQRLIWALAAASPSALGTASLIVLVSSIVEGSFLLLRQRWTKFFLPALWWTLAVWVDDVNMLQVAVVAIIVWSVSVVTGWSGSFVLFGYFALLLQLSKVQDLWITEFLEVVI